MGKIISNEQDIVLVTKQDLIEQLKEIPQSRYLFEKTSDEQICLLLDDEETYCTPQNKIVLLPKGVEHLSLPNSDDEGPNSDEEGSDPYPIEPLVVPPSRVAMDMDIGTVIPPSPPSRPSRSIPPSRVTP